MVWICRNNSDVPNFGLTWLCRLPEKKRRPHHWQSKTAVSINRWVWVDKWCSSTSNLKPLPAKWRSSSFLYLNLFQWTHVTVLWQNDSLHSISSSHQVTLWNCGISIFIIFLLKVSSQKFIKQDSLSLYKIPVRCQPRCTSQKLVKSSIVVCLSTRTSKNLPFLMFQGAMIPLQSSSCMSPSKHELNTNTSSLSYRKQVFLLQTEG